MTELEDYDELHKLLEKYEARYPSDAAKYLLENIKEKSAERLKDLML